MEEVLDHVAAIMSTCVGQKHLELVVSSAPEQVSHLIGMPCASSRCCST